MAISEVEYQKEVKILGKVQKLLDKTLNDLGGDVFDKEEGLTEFKKMVWEDASSFDNGEMQQVMAATALEANKVFMKRNYFRKLLGIKDKPYFASIVFKDDEGKIFNIYIIRSLLVYHRYGYF